MLLFGVVVFGVCDESGVREDGEFASGLCDDGDCADGVLSGDDGVVSGVDGAGVGEVCGVCCAGVLSGDDEGCCA